MTELARPGFLIAGAQKAGTSALTEYLSRHPQIAAPLHKEIDFFWLDSRYGKGMEWYLAQFPTLSEGEAFSFEASPHYLCWPVAHRRIREFDPEMKFIVLLREPAERAWSQYRHYLRKEGSTDAIRQSMNTYGAALGNFYSNWLERGRLPSFETLVNSEMDELVKGCILPPFLLYQGMYIRHLQSLESQFDRSNILILGAGALRKDSTACLDRITSFLGIELHDWSARSLEAVNSFPDDPPMPESVSQNLNAFFDTANQQLFDWLGHQPDW